MATAVKKSSYTLELDEAEARSLLALIGGSTSAQLQDAISRCGWFRENLKATADRVEGIYDALIEA